MIRKVHRSRERGAERDDPVLQMLGVGKELWVDESGEEFIARERASWDNPPAARDEKAGRSQRVRDSSH
jgi:hypothetical protein